MLFLRSVGGIPVGSEETNNNAFIEAQKLLKKNKLLLIFPEGKINADPDLLPFKSGFLRLAVECNVPVVPVIIMGSEKSLKSGQFFPRPSNIYVRFLEPQSFNNTIEYADGLLDKKELQYHVEKVRNIIQNEFNLLREIYAAR
jgi:1-acyl-sn-glycerol-3-phosphate acyltransferase